MTLGSYRWLRPQGRRSAQEIAVEFSTALLRGMIRDEAVRAESPLGLEFQTSHKRGNRVGMRTDTDMAPDPAVLMLAGDWHGNMPWAESVIRHAAERDVDTILQLGDFGYWTDDPATDEYLSTVNDRLDSSGIRLYWIDGNHEDHTRVDDWTDAYRHPQVRYLPRGFRWRWWDMTWMSVGGAMSVDKHYRLEGEAGGRVRNSPMPTSSTPAATATST